MEFYLSREQPSPILEPKGWGTKMPQWPQEGWVIALAGAAGEVRLPNTKWGEALRGALWCNSKSGVHSPAQN